jgi:hypothetical protein
MAYSLIATSNKEPDWQKLHQEVFNPDSAIEMFPITSDEPGVFYLGISIPLFKLDKHPATWKDLVEVITKLKTKHNCEIFDLYNGFLSMTKI